ncbi:hypothetical protein F0A17_00160 [Billgrantia pellis]|uniref:HEAT repeat domain-containing protein n=1 Tax=Billgrantia pellis TaxID=2606936 RepID=A0A7V7G239_9GAMM|nr:hypothetical protein [Halomonas pellis]KAA0014124.1 hypothetical protein F0A17_00160 [Halomonas pellis]
MAFNRIAGGLLLAMLIGACTSSPTAPTEEAPAAPPATGETTQQEVTPVATSREDRFWKPPLFVTEEDEAHYYISRLADRRFVDVYGGEEHPRVWYIAAERLGQIGEPAISLLFGLIDSQDPYELMLVLYALQLATQDPRVMAQTGGDYVRLNAVLDESANEENRDIALAWWQRHGWRWE